LGHQAVSSYGSQMDSTCTQPRLVARRLAAHLEVRLVVLSEVRLLVVGHGGDARGVAAQVEFESKGLQPRYTSITCKVPRVETRRFQALYGSIENPNFDTRISRLRFQGLKPGAFKLVGQLDSACTAPPPWSSRRSCCTARWL
jgi:hypothetical protein